VSAQDGSADRQAAAARYMSVVPMSKMLEDSFTELAKQLPQDKRAGFIAKMNQTVRADALERIALDSMVKTFTADELNALADFYGSKPGRSAMQKFGLYMGQVMPAVQAEIQRVVQQQSSQGLTTPAIAKEQRGNVTNLRAEGSLASTQAIGCIPIAQAKNTFTPADLYKGVSECIAQEKYDFAAGLFLLAGMYVRFDAERLTDKTAGQAGSVLIMNTFSTLPQEKKTKFGAAVERIAKNPELLRTECGDVQKLGMPNYYPSYMILHGIKAFTGNPHEGALVKGFDAPGVWKTLQTTALHCPN
jgi:hypothetical protein